MLKRNWVLIGYTSIQNKKFKELRGKMIKENFGNSTGNKHLIVLYFDLFPQMMGFYLHIYSCSK